MITLVIIGLVAAITIPTVVNNYQEKQTVVKLKKIYSVLSQAYLYSVADGDPITNYSKNNDSELSKLLFERFKPYLKISKECGYGYMNTNCMPQQYKAFDESAEYTVFGEESTKYLINLADGASIAFYGYNSDNFLPDQSSVYYPPNSKLYGTIYYDINGNSEPNTFGRDLFQFALITEGIVPYGKGEDNYMDNCYKSGFKCSPWVISQNNMNYIRCKDLSEDGKTDCN